LLTLAPSLSSELSKLFSETDSTHKIRSLIPETGELAVSCLAELSFIFLTNELLWLTPAMIIPMIRTAIESSISEKAEFLFILVLSVVLFVGVRVLVVVIINHVSRIVAAANH